MSWNIATVLESDEELRARLLYVACDGPALEHRIRNASGEKLDDLASCYNLKRRRL